MNWFLNHWLKNISLFFIPFFLPFLVCITILCVICINWCFIYTLTDTSTIRRKANCRSSSSTRESHSPWAGSSNSLESHTKSGRDNVMIQNGVLKFSPLFFLNFLIPACRMSFVSSVSLSIVLENIKLILTLSRIQGLKLKLFFHLFY